MAAYEQWIRDYLKQNYNKLSWEELEEYTGKKRSSLHAWMRRNGLSRQVGYKRFSKDELDFITKHFKTKSSAWISAELNRPIVSINTKARELNLKKDNLVRNGDLSILLNKSLQSSYWLGYYCADGSITKNGCFRFSQAEKDKSQVYLLSEYLGTKVNIAKNGQHCISLYHPEVAHRINKILGVDLNQGTKTHTSVKTDYFDTEDHMRSFLSGFIDGDGHITSGLCVEIQCAIEYYLVFNEILKNIPELNLAVAREKYHKTHDKKYAFMYINRKKSIKFFTELTRLNLPLNKRKWEQYEKYVQKPNQGL